MAPISPHPRVATESKVMSMPDKLSVTEPHTQLCFLHVAVPLLTRQLKPYFGKKKKKRLHGSSSWSFRLLCNSKHVI